jgi:hypothetical protein
MPAAITWERLLVIWGFVAPGIAWLATRGWERKSQEILWKHEKEMRGEQRKIEDERMQAEREQKAIEAVRERMRDIYTRFLEGASAIDVASAYEFRDQSGTGVNAATPGFVLSFQQLLLVASLETAELAVEVWNQTLKLSRLHLGDPTTDEIRTAIRDARRRFVTEAREDIEDPRERTAHPGVSLKVPTLGGFHLVDAG